MIGEAFNILFQEEIAWVDQKKKIRKDIEELNTINQLDLTDFCQGSCHQDEKDTAAK